MSLIIAYILDLIIGDPQGFPHPIRLMGKLIESVEKFLRKKCRSREDEIQAGALLWFTVVSLSFIVPFIILYAALKINLILYIIIESIMCYYILAVKSLKDESMKVYYSLKNNDIIAALFMIVSSFILKMDYVNAYKIYKRDRYNHKSPNSAQTESVCAGALNLMLGGNSYYGNILIEKPTIGDNNKEAEAEDILRANKLMYATSILCLVLGIILKYCLSYIGL